MTMMSTTAGSGCDVDPFSCVFSLASTAGLLLPSTEVQLLVDVLESLKNFVGNFFFSDDSFYLSLGESISPFVCLYVTARLPVFFRSLIRPSICLSFCLSACLVCPRYLFIRRRRRNLSPFMWFYLDLLLLRHK